ncbi:S66 peptidase family protein [Mucilaginibacter ginkgonis]|uniref:LD-carboxypeptidase n=1 Tax=Mucilaginibacter ginkgonis TaxID=2682091 RepID=A0A6I4HXH0_9SPHI|nr:LD-carboxypeptidase [Mucilaginibacter ginkgonis]QQL51452.1 LD-carboxypeptidase [Mucilaginibacter ginkgonis]
MNRKYFITSLAFATALPTLNLEAKTVANTGSLKIPPYLKPGDTIGISCPASDITVKEVESAKQLMESWGFKVVLGETVGKKDMTYGGTDDERLADFQKMLDDTDIKAIMCGRGGYGVVRIIDRLNFSRFARQPKWIIGFSDITVLHSHINRNFSIATLHAKMCNSFPDDWTKAEPIQIETINSIKQALTGERMSYTSPPTNANRAGSSKAQLIGGNLSILSNLSGTKSQTVTQGKILFIEDTGEYPYNIDRLLWNLKRSGQLTGLAGLIIGGFKMKPDDAGEEFGKTIYDIVLEKVKGYNYPVCFDFPVGHQRNNFALKCGVVHELTVTAEGGKLVSM